jgi:hypothetical protein
MVESFVNWPWGFLEHRGKHVLDNLDLIRKDTLTIFVAAKARDNV